MAAGGRLDGGSPQDEDAKHALDRIGAEVQKEAHSAALQRSNSDLHGLLSRAKFNGQKTNVRDPCQLDHKYETNVGTGKSDPCANRSPVRFSDESRSQCTKNRIKDSTSDTVGACAPYRRLNLCDRNLEEIEPEKIESTDNLLVDVLLAAKHEGNILSQKLQEYDKNNYESRICTVLARSFADIGDIIRGKDLYRGNKQEKDALQEQLKKYFKELHNHLKLPEKNHYQSNDTNYFELREDWWELNRLDVWKAITCDAPEDAKYFRNACSEGTTPTQGKCRCATNYVPTNFDYVPQFLRWFDEWTEEFCRIKELRLQNVKNSCRGVNESGNKRYCSRNGCDCEETINKIGHLRYGNRCIKCLFGCNRYIDWIKNKQKEFGKQKKKCENEIYNRNQSQSLSSSVNDMYYKNFYEKFRKKYPKFNDFLTSLNEESKCKNLDPEYNESKIDFNNNKTTFSGSQYCKPCPPCGVKKDNDGNFVLREENDPKCKDKNLYTPKKHVIPTDITILSSGEGNEEIAKNLNIFCDKSKGNNNSTLYEEWKCYYENVENEACIKEKPLDGNVKKQKSYNNFFYYWVAHMLKDSIHWRTKRLKSCISNGKTIKCKNGCNKKCDCFQKWIDKKKTEWENIKIHFKKQNDIVNVEGPIAFSHYGVLEYVLKEEFYKEKSEENSKNSLDEEEAEELKHLRQIIESEENQEPVGATGKKTIMDKLIDYEERIAKNCLKTHTKDDCPKVESPGRAATDPQPQPAQESDEEEEDEEEEEEEETAEGEKPTEDGAVSQPETQPAEATEEQVVPGPSATEVTEVKPCQIVATLFTTPKSLNEACKQKYDGKYYGWKCIPTSGDNNTRGNDATTGKSDGSICVPPRRRRLYVGKLHEWVDTVETQTSGTPSPSDKLRTAFIESAAVETFFLWHKYKVENSKRQGGSPLLTTVNGDTLGDSGEQTPEQQLSRGDIPPDFLRLMFYTLGDYRDICIGKTPDGIDTVSASDKDTKGESDMQKIKKAIESVFNSGNNQKSGSTPSPGDKNPGQTTKPEDWWQKNGEHIWKGMICALTYDTNTASGDKDKAPTQIPEVRENLWDEQNNKPKDQKYQYTNVTISSVPSGENTPLSKFVLRPTYFRYLEEWGETFCRQRTRMLKNVKDNCTQGDGRCSGDGENCKDILNQDYDTVSDLKCPRCGKSCGFYKKWIERKGKEFEKQKSAYEQQKEKYTKTNEGAEGNNGGNGFCKTLKSLSDAAQFLERLGPCSKNENGVGKTDFNNQSKTFKHTEYCDPCSLIGAKCKNGYCKGANGNTCNGETITSDAIGKMVNSTEINILVSDNDTNTFEGDALEPCRSADIFKGFREDVWKCGKVCGVDICKLQKNNNGEANENPIIQIRALLKRWVEFFIDDYNRIRKKLKPCIENGEANICINDCEKKCKCVKNWIDQKREEWQKIKKLFNDQYKSNDSDNSFPVRSFLETFLVQIGAANVQNKIIKLSKFGNSCGCSADAKEQNKNGYQDAIECMLKKLEKKISECKTQASEETQNQTCQNPTPELDEEDLLLEEENTVEAPKICENVLKTQTPEEKEEDACKQAEEPTEEKSNDDQAKPTEQVPKSEKEVPQEPAPAAPTSPPTKPPPLPSDNTSDILKTTIPFGIALALTSIALLFLKKKTKSTIDLLRVINIPKSDYDIPTKLSPNRYIPYTSGKYRGKRYIYLEGDSATDSGYTDHYSDITSSSESEYEELDINDIYVPRAPKYKTLIEVVLEPSGNNTTASGKNTTASGNNTTASGNNTTASDTQNDIQNDGIPSSKITDNEWNTLKDEFISQYLQSEQPNDVPNDYSSGDIPFNTQPNTLYFDNNQEKPFITSIHDRNLYTGEEHSYNVNMSTNIMDDPKHVSNNVYSGIDLINDTLSGNEHIDIYDELLKRKENELFGTEHHPKNITSNRVVTQTSSDDPLLNQLELFHTWLDRHRDMCEKWKNNHERLPKLKELWENETHSGNTHPSDSNKTLNTDVSIQIDMDNPKPKNEFKNMDTTPNKSTMDTMLDDLEKYNEPYYYDFYKNDIYYDVNDDDKTSVDHINMDHNKMDNNNSDVPTKVQIEMNIVNNKKEIFEEKYPISDIWNI